MKGLISKLEEDFKKIGRGIKNNFVKRPALYIAGSVAMPFLFAAGCSESETTAPILDVTRLVVGSASGHWGSYHAPDYAICKSDGTKPDYSKVNATGFNMSVKFVDSNETWLRVDGAPLTLKNQHNKPLLGINPGELGWTTGNCVNSNTLHGASSLDNYGNSCSIFTNGIGEWPIGGIYSWGRGWRLSGEEGEVLPPIINIVDKKFTIYCPASSELVGAEATYHIEKSLHENYFYDSLTGGGWVFDCGIQFEYEGPITSSSSMNLSMTDFKDIHLSLESAKVDNAIIKTNSSVGTLTDIVCSTPIYKRYPTGGSLDVDANDFQTNHNYEEEIAYEIIDANDIFIYRGIRWGFEIEKTPEMHGVNILNEKFTKHGQSAMINVIDKEGNKTGYKTYVYPYKDYGDSFLAVSEEILPVWNQDVSGHYVNENPVEGYEDLFYARKLVVPVEKQGRITCPLPIEDNSIKLKEIGEFVEVYLDENRYDWRWDKNYDSEIDLKDFAMIANRYNFE